jgi:hypothetical protein
MLATSTERQNKMHLLIAKELEINGLRFEHFKWLYSYSVLLELSNIITSEAHEGIVSSTGAIFVEQASDLFGVNYILIPTEKINMARKLANGIDCFIIYEKEIFFGLVYFKLPILNELLFIRAFPPSGGLFVQRNTDGIIKFFQGNNIILLENRRWFTKPLMKEAAWKISQCISEIDFTILNRILDFSFHQLSPMPQVGATIIWWLIDPPNTAFEIQISEQNISELDFSIMDETKSHSYCSLLSQIDGATFIDQHGDLTNIGVHLKNSAKSRELIPELKGTRHTSAQRFSYDYSEALVITISSDGPVTIFSDGVNIAELSIHSSHKSAHELKKRYPNKKEQIVGSSREMTCPNCDKLLMLELVEIKDWNKSINVSCSICHNFFITLDCFTVECRPYKRLFI